MNLLRLAFAVLTGAALQAAPPSVGIWTGADIKHAAAGLAPASGSMGIAGTTLGTYGNHSTAIWRRTRSGQAELHKVQTDLLIIEDGQATLRYGGAVANGRSVSAVEIRGASISGGESREVRPGDVIRIPAGVPHQFILGSGQTVSYFAVKIAR